MPMEAAAMDKLVQKGEFRPQVAQAIAEAIDITIKAANLVTVPMLDARFAALETKLEIRFSSIEKSMRPPRSGRPCSTRASRSHSSAPWP